MQVHAPGGIKGGVMTTTEDVLDVALKAGESVLVHAEGNPAQVVAWGVAAAAVVVATAVGYGAYCAGEKFVGWLRYR